MWLITVLLVILIANCYNGYINEASTNDYYTL